MPFHICSSIKQEFVSPQIPTYLSNKIIITPFTYPLLSGGYGKGVFIMSKYKVIALANQKGGVSKITINENVAIGKQIR